MSETPISPEVREKILRLVEERQTVAVPFDRIESMTIIELGIDSMQLLRLAFDIEIDYRLKMNLDKISASTTVKGFIDQLEPLKD
jgi:acyl carrier protein